MLRGYHEFFAPSEGRLAGNLLKLAAKVGLFGLAYHFRDGSNGVVGVFCQQLLGIFYA